MIIYNVNFEDYILFIKLYCWSSLFCKTICRPEGGKELQQNVINSSKQTEFNVRLMIGRKDDILDVTFNSNNSTVTLFCKQDNNTVYINMVPNELILIFKQIPNSIYWRPSTNPTKSAKCYKAKSTHKNALLSEGNLLQRWRISNWNIVTFCSLPHLPDLSLRD